MTNKLDIDNAIIKVKAMKLPRTKIYRYKGKLKILFTDEYNQGGSKVNKYLTEERLQEFGKNLVTEEMLEKRLRQFGLELEQKLDEKFEKNNAQLIDKFKDLLQKLRG